MLLDNLEGVAALALVGFGLGHEVADHGRRLQQAQGLEGDQLGVAGADAEAEEAAFACAHHSTSVARALTAATAMALPPRRPRTIT